jgi:heptosyltransferase-3
LTISTLAPDDYAGHQADYLADQLHPWPAAESAAKQILHSIAERGVGAGPVAGGPVIIHPGGGAARKCWPAERYIDLAHRLKAAGRSVRVLLGEVELEKWEPGVIEAFRTAADAETPKTLLDLLAQITRGSAFIGNDSGPGHLAGIVGLPTLSLMGEASKVERWRPLGPRVTTLSEPLDTMTVDAVFKRVGEMLGASRH